MTQSGLNFLFDESFAERKLRFRRCGPLVRTEDSSFGGLEAFQSRGTHPSRSFFPWAVSASESTGCDGSRSCDRLENKEAGVRKLSRRER